MGVYDNIDVSDEGYDDQLKCWSCSGSIFTKGDTVPEIDGNTTYSVRLREVGEPTPLTGIADRLRGFAQARADLTDKREPKSKGTRYVTVEEGVITSTFADNPLSDKPVYDKWGDLVVR